MSHVLLLLVPLFLLGFWGRMFFDMTRNDSLPPCFLSVSGGRNIRLDWTVMFVVFNVVAAGYYFFTAYQDE